MANTALGGWALGMTLQKCGSSAAVVLREYDVGKRSETFSENVFYRRSAVEWGSIGEKGPRARKYFDRFRDRGQAIPRGVTRPAALVRRNSRARCDALMSSMVHERGEELVGR